MEQESISENVQSCLSAHGLSEHLYLKRRYGKCLTTLMTEQQLRWALPQQVPLFLLRKQKYSQVKQYLSLELPARWDRLHRSEEHTSELQSRPHLVCRLL